MEPQLTTYLGQYQLVEVVGRTAAAVVYRAHQGSLNRSVAIKVLLRNFEPHYVSRFEREAQAVAQLQHRNILPIYDYGLQGPWRYIVMQYVENSTTLGDLIAAGPVDDTVALRLLVIVLDALGYAHSQGVIHRDIKPSNILMPWPDWPLLADFGIAKLLGAPQQLTPPGQAVGTAAYMAPEAGLQRPIDARADLYSAGVVLYEMLTRQLPFEAPTPLAMLSKHIKEPPPLPRTLRPDMHPAVEAVLLRALAKDPDDRYQSAAEMAGALERAARQVERAKAQAWLSGQLAAISPLPLSRRSGYTTRKLPPLSSGALAAPASNASRAAPVTPASPSAPSPLLPRPARTRPPVYVLLLGLTLLLGLAVGAVALWPRPAEVGQTPTAPVEGPTASAEAPPVTLPTSIPPAAEAPPVSAPPTSSAPENTPRPQPSASPAPVQVILRGDATVLYLDDPSWSGGYSFSRGSNRYGGRTATWIYGATTTYNIMTVSFELAEQPTGDAELLIEGMDSEGRSRTPISIEVNGIEVYTGPNPLPDDDLPLETGTWASETWRFDGALLRPGRNELTIRNLAEGAFGGPPFFMLDYAELTYRS
jgi:serine/threonine protein kinase